MSDSLQETDPIGGWVKGFGACFDNTTDARELHFEKLILDEERKLYFQRYLNEYYSASFIYGQGTEHILAMSARHSTGGRWLDIGSGTSALFWATAFREINAVTCVDLVPEALYVFDRFRSSETVPRCYEEALRISGNSVETLTRTRSAPWRFHQCNVLAPWASHFAGQSFDMITAYAVFGLAATEEGYRQSFRHLREAAECTSVVLGADWIRSDAFVKHEGHDNRYVSKNACITAATQAGFTVLECEYHNIEGDPLYSGVVSWALK